MAWVRRVRTASGATAVQIAESVDGRRRIVAHVGSAHTEAELGLLIEEARGMLDDAAQGALDLAVEPAPRRARLISKPVAAEAGAQGLFAVPESASGTGRSRQTPRARSPRVGPPRVVGTSSGLLFDALAAVYDDLGFTAVADTTFRDLVISRIVEPTSILDTGRVLTDLGQRPPNERTMRRTLGRAQQRGYRDTVATVCFDHALTCGDVSLCLYDVTVRHEALVVRVGVRDLHRWSLP